MIVSDASKSSCPSLAGVEFAQYLLVCHARTLTITQGVWCFTLETLSGRPLLDAEDEEEGDLNRLSLLAAVRGLEAIDGSGRVTLVSNNRYLIRSLDQSLPRWRENDFIWENFGRKIPVQNADLWRRIDRTLAIHEVTASLVQTTRVRGQQPAPPLNARGEPLSRGPRLSASGLSVAGRIDRAHASAAAPPTDRLRRWLAGHDDAVVRPARRGRYRPEDWPAESEQ